MRLHVPASTVITVYAGHAVSVDEAEFWESPPACSRVSNAEIEFADH